MASFLVLPLLLLITGFISPPLPTLAAPPSTTHFHRSSSVTGSEIDAFLHAHNRFRTNCDAPQLSWNSELADKAAKWADQCRLELSNSTIGDPSSPYGENIIAAAGKFPIDAAVGVWAQEGGNYDPDHYEKAAHFSQVVWINTKGVGCAYHKCNNIIKDQVATLYVCFYTPRGNVWGWFNENVHATAPNCIAKPLGRQGVKHA